MEVVLGMPFLTLSNADIRFAERELVWRSYTAEKALPTTRRVELIDRREFAAVALDENEETFVLHVAALLEAPTIAVHPFRRAQVTSLLTKPPSLFHRIFRLHRRLLTRVRRGASRTHRYQ